eukprot:4288295-Pleurochrysis_carterae.AAC.1
MRSASYAQSGSAPRAPSLCLRRSGMGSFWCRAAASLIGNTCTSAHSCPSLIADGCIHCTEAHVRSRVLSNSRSVGWPTSPARSSRLWARSAAAHSIRATRVPFQPLASAMARKCCAQNARLSFRVPDGGSS